MTATAVDRRHRLLAAAVASVLFLSAVLGVNRARELRSDATAPVAAGASPSATDEPATPGDPSPRPSPSPSPTRSPAATLAHPDAAAGVAADDLLAAGLAAAQGPWRDLGDPTWPTRGERPVYVAAVDVDADDPRVAADVVVATRLTDATAELVLRLLPGAAAFGDVVPTVEVTVDGDPVEATVDRAGARLVVPLGRERRAGEAVSVRVRLTYDLVPTAAIVDDGGPAAFGLLADHGGVLALGHWLPLLTLPGEDGPMVRWGDVGGFPVAVWSLRTTHDGTLVTGGEDAPCPGTDAAPRSCTTSRGIALRDVSAVLLAGEAVVAETEVAGVRHRAVAAAGPRSEVEAVLAEAVAAATSFTSRFGPLAWREVDTVAVPLGRGAAGMEFPGLSFIDDEQWTELDGGFGTAVLVHEVAHQWFHALVGNGSLSDPVVDESMAQYLSMLAWRDRFGEAAARTFAERSFGGRYAAARARGVEEEPPAQPLDAFPGAASYGAMVYARAPLAWVLAEERIGVAAVEAFLTQVVAAYGLATVSDDQLVADAEAFDPELGAILRRVWLDEEPLG